MRPNSAWGPRPKQPSGAAAAVVRRDLTMAAAVTGRRRTYGRCRRLAAAPGRLLGRLSAPPPTAMGHVTTSCLSLRLAVGRKGG